MPATTASALWNTGRRACAFLLIAAVSIAAQTSEPASADHLAGISCISLESDGPQSAEESIRTQYDNKAHRLTWRSGLNAVQKVSVSAPRVPGLWIRLTSDAKESLNWKFVPLETGRPRDLLMGSERSRVSLWLHYDFLDASFRQGLLPVVFTLTEG